MPILVKKFPDSEAALAFYVDLVAKEVIVSLNDDQDYHLLLTGGGSGTDFGNGLGKLLCEQIKDISESKAQLHLWWSDERFEEIDSPDRSDSKVLDSFSALGNLINAHRPISPSQSSIENCVIDFKGKISETLGERSFDFTILGFGNDGHLASCFPEDTSTLHSTDNYLAIKDSPKPPKERTTFTLSRLAKSKHIVVLALGTAKQGALTNTLAGSGKFPVEILSKLNPTAEVILATDLTA